MRYRNKVELIGNLGQDPKVVQLEKGIAVNISLATNKPYKANGETEYETEWHDISIYGRHAEYAAKELKKGMCILIEAKLRTRTVDTAEGGKLRVKEIVVNERQHCLMILDRASSQNSTTHVHNNSDDSSTAYKGKLPTTSTSYAAPPQRKSELKPF
ncbi:single-stranded DNA-binding protein [Enterovibrio norvegicus]|uniref:single-stranded DNA-binding protein n=1 Tax=Enterovibrio norvegicus TaxID=188144 RepID=UPI000C821836|nr:single-stranded DNA-binding protein [Enterovibrio norvegicus]PMH64572.1 hypothetical protein BCU62_16075 [Enterovibrio norvegicus]